MQGSGKAKYDIKVLKKNKENLKYASKIKRPFLNENQINKRLEFSFEH